MTVTADVAIEGLEGERNNTILAMVVARAWRDPAYRDRLVDTPRAVLAEEGLELPADVDVEVLQDTPAVKYINLARNTADAASVAGVLTGLIPVPEGGEIRLVQSTPAKRFLVIPTMPEGLDSNVTSDSVLTTKAGEIRDGVYVYTIEGAVVGTTVSILAEAVGVIVLT
jgi:Nitrile hydratase, alpha chain